MPFWSSHLVDPKRGYRWVAGGNDASGKSIPYWICSKVTKPSLTVTNSEHSYLNYTYNFPARGKWEPITLTIVDPVTPDASQILMEIVERAGYKPPVNDQQLSTMGKEKSVEALGRFTIDQIDHNGKGVDSFTLWNAWVADVKFGELDYKSDELVNIELKIVYDHAIFASLDGFSPNLWSSVSAGIRGSSPTP